MPTKSARTLDPIVTLQIGKESQAPRELGSNREGSLSSVTSVCFLTATNQENVNVLPGKQEELSRRASDSDSSTTSNTKGDDDLIPAFRTRSLTRGEKNSDDDITAAARESAAALLLTGRLLATCHANGDAFIWDLSQQSNVHQWVPSNHRRGPGLAIRRIHAENSGSCSTRFVYHTRDENGTVSLYDMETFCSDLNSRSRPGEPRSVASFETQSRTFCAASPCVWNANLVAVPAADDAAAAVCDWRMSPRSKPAVFLPDAGAGGIVPSSPATMSVPRKHGMLTSLALTQSSSTNSRCLLACGMESGSLFFHDIAMPNKIVNMTLPNENGNSDSTDGHSSDNSGMRGRVRTSTCLALGKNPILALEMASSTLPRASRSGDNYQTILDSFVTVAGLADDDTEWFGTNNGSTVLENSTRGTVVVVKTSVVQNENIDETGQTIQSRIRARLPTITTKSTADFNYAGKPGVSLLRFRSPDNRIFAVGGWDKRLRIFDRATETPLAILKGHTGSVNAVDWAPDANQSGLLATGSSDGRIHIWRCFSK